VVEINVVLSCLQCESRDIDGHMENAEEGQGEHGRDALSDRAPMDLVQFWSTVSRRGRTVVGEMEAYGTESRNATMALRAMVR
jgi:hypothetical protein